MNDDCRQRRRRVLSQFEDLQQCYLRLHKAGKSAAPSMLPASPSTHAANAAAAAAAAHHQPQQQQQQQQNQNQQQQNQQQQHLQNKQQQQQQQQQQHGRRSKRAKKDSGGNGRLQPPADSPARLDPLSSGSDVQAAGVSPVQVAAKSAGSKVWHQHCFQPLLCRSCRSILFGSINSVWSCCS